MHFTIPLIREQQSHQLGRPACPAGLVPILDCLSQYLGFTSVNLSCTYEVIAAEISKNTPI